MKTIISNRLPGFMVSRGTNTLSKETGAIGLGGDATGVKLAGGVELKFNKPVGCAVGADCDPSDSKLSIVGTVAFCSSAAAFSCNGVTVCFCFCCCFWVCITSWPSKSRGFGALAWSFPFLLPAAGRFTRPPNPGDVMLRLLVPVLTGPGIWGTDIVPNPMG